jgi:1,4-alpha-glucan branching enzyme
LPFYPSPRRDNGYDISNYYGIDPKLGTLDEFREFVAASKSRGIKIMIDLVVHHLRGMAAVIRAYPNAFMVTETYPDRRNENDGLIDLSAVTLEPHEGYVVVLD